MYWLAPHVHLLTFGLFKIQTVSSIIKDSIADNILRDNIERMINTIDYEATKRMREAVSKLTNKIIKEFPENREAVLYARVPISTSICDNHITRDLKDGAEKYLKQKLQKCYEAPLNDITPAEKATITWVVLHWMRAVAKIQLRSVEDKLAEYYRAKGYFRSTAFEKGLQIRIDKNEEYRKILKNLDMDKFDTNPKGIPAGAGQVFYSRHTGRVIADMAPLSPDRPPPKNPFPWDRVEAVIWWKTDFLGRVSNLYIVAKEDSSYSNGCYAHATQADVSGLTFGLNVPKW
jgi:hypothetical protein